MSSVSRNPLPALLERLDERRAPRGDRHDVAGPQRQPLVAGEDASAAADTFHEQPLSGCRELERGDTTAHPASAALDRIGTQLDLAPGLDGRRLAAEHLVLELAALCSEIDAQQLGPSCDKIHAAAVTPTK